MCGISAILSKKDENITPFIIKSLISLQNRGYDSVGIGYFENSILKEEKMNDSENNDCFHYIEEVSKNINSNLMIGHTRWATHGGKKRNNAHPHTSMNKNFMLIHNGIIENYMILKEELLKKGYTFQSQTDSEVIVNLIDSLYLENNHNIINAIQNACEKIEGTYGLTILCKDTPNTLYVIRNGSPLIYAENDEMIMVSSEPNGLNNIFTNYYVLDPQELFVINNNGLVNTSLFQNKVPKKVIIDEDSESSTSLEGYKHFMLKEIYQQSKTILNAINHGGRIFNDTIKLGGLDEKRNILTNVEHLILLGCGTSYHAALIGKYYFQQFRTFNTIQVFDGGEFSEDDIPLNGSVCIIFCSQSGETLDLYKALKRVHNSERKNIITCGVINVVDSLIAREVDCGVYLNAGREIGVASTKSFTSMCIILSLIAMWFYQLKNKDSLKIKNYLNSLRSLHYKVEFLLKEINVIDSYLNIFEEKHNLFILGKSKFESISREASLKIKEISYIHSEAYSGSALKHGPFALLEKDFPVILLIDHENESKMMNVYEEIKSRGANILVISNIKRLNERLDIKKKIILPYIEHYDEILYIILLQYLSYTLAIKRGNNPDKPRNLAKVVTVE